MFVETHRRVPPHPDHPGTLGTGMTWCHRLSVLSKVALAPDPPESLMPCVVVSGLAPSESPIAGVVVSVRAQPFPSLPGPMVSVVLFPTLVS